MEAPVHFLLVEDNLADIRITTEAFEESGATFRLTAVRSGEDAIRFLEGEGRFEDRELPDLILLDLNLPGVDGHEVLRHVKMHPALRGIPVVVLTSSNREKDIQKAYAAHANCYLEKPMGFDGYVSLARLIREFWSRTARPTSP